MSQEKMILASGEEIRAARKRKGLTQKQLAEKMGVTETYISQYERGLRRPKPETVKRIADALGIEEISISASDFERKVADFLSLPVELIKDFRRDYRVPLFVFRNANGCYWTR